MKQPAISAANKTYRVIQNAESNNDGTWNKRKMVIF